ncbi:MAG: GNAT family N-acetyltransferase [Sphingobium sp.]
MEEVVALQFQVAGRSLWRVHRRLRVVSYSLDDALAECPPRSCESGADGYLFRSLPVVHLPLMHGRMAGWLVAARQYYPRHHVAMAGRDFDQWWAGFSGRTRSTLSRKARRLANHLGGTLSINAYRSAEEVAWFMALARPLSQRTYQERLLQAGLPASPAAVASAVEAAGRGDVRAFLLFAGDRPIAYLYLPVRDDVLVYAYLGYDPDFASFSPGTVLHVEAMRQLFAEGRFRYFDFTEGDGAHKALFGRETVACVDLLVMRPTWGNRLTLGALNAFDRITATAKRLLARGGPATRAIGAIRRWMRR